MTDSIFTPERLTPVATTQMAVRKEDADGDYVFGHGTADFWRNQPEAVAQRIKTRLLLMQGEWFLDNSDGTPYATDILGVRTGPTYDPAIKSRISGTPAMREIVSYTSKRHNRALSIHADVRTEYGPITVITPLSIFGRQP